MKTSDVLFYESFRENERNLETLRDRLAEAETMLGDEWVLCLGAGVSISVGLPSWYKLLAEITAQIIAQEIGRNGESKRKGNSSYRAYYDDIKDFYSDVCGQELFYEKIISSFSGKYTDVFSGINVLEAAEYIRNFIRHDAQELNTVRLSEDEVRARTNYRMNYFIRQTYGNNKLDDWLKDEELPKSTLAAVAGLMKSEHDSIIHNAITYNYDNLLETYLRNVSGCGEDKVHSIVKTAGLEDFQKKSDEWNIYHIHGRIPVFEFEGEEMSDRVIFTESDYYEEEQLSYSWINILQSYAILRSNLIFVGFSGTDYNFRRIIKYVDKEGMGKRTRYIFFLVDDIVSSVFRKEICSGKNCDQCVAEMNLSGNKYRYEKLFINYLIHSQTIYWQEHGLEVIWSSLKELPCHINGLHPKQK